MLTLNKISTVLFIVFLLDISLDPTGSILGAKELLFILLLLLAIIMLYHKPEPIPRLCLSILLLCVSIPVYGLMIALLKGNLTDSSYAFGHLKSFLFIFLFFFLINMNFNAILKGLFICGTLIAFCTSVIFSIAQINPDLFTLIYNQSIEDSNIIISQRAYFSFSILGVYFKAGPLILFSYIYSLYFYPNRRWRKAFIVVNLFALLIAGSRTPMLMGVFITLIYLYDKQRFGKFFKCLFLFISIVGVAFITYKLATEKGESSNELKFNDFSSYIHEIFSGTTFIIGDGVGSEFYSAGRNQMVSNSEQTYMDIFRIYGLIIGGVLILAVFCPPIYFLYSKLHNVLRYQRFMLAYVLYMILAGTNPLLISSTGMLIWAIGLTFVHQLKTKQLDYFDLDKK